MLEILRRDSPWLWGYHPKNYVLLHGWLHNVKANVMANNKLKYWRLETGLRDKLCREWNRPAYLPLGIAVFVILSLSGWLWWKLRLRDEAR